MFVAWLMVLGIGLAVAVSGGWAVGRRRRGLERFARDHGFDFYPTDPFGLIDHSFDLFCLGDRPQCENVLVGSWDGIEVRVADLWFAGPAGDASQRLATEGTLGLGVLWSRQLCQRRLRFSFAVVDMGASVPHIAIKRRDVGSLLASTLEPNGLRFESERFNHLYEVRTEDRAYAWRFVDAGLMGSLLDLAAAGADVSVEASGRHLLVYSRRRRPEQLFPLVLAAGELVRHVPRVVLRQYAPPTMT